MGAVRQYRLAIIYAIFFSVGALASVIAVALEHVNFRDLQVEDYIVLIALITASWCNTMMAFLSKAAHGTPSDTTQPTKQP